MLYLDICNQCLHSNPSTNSKRSHRSSVPVGLYKLNWGYLFGNGSSSSSQILYMYFDLQRDIVSKIYATLNRGSLIVTLCTLIYGHYCKQHQKRHV